MVPEQFRRYIQEEGKQYTALYLLTLPLNPILLKYGLEPFKGTLQQSQLLFHNIVKVSIILQEWEAGLSSHLCTAWLQEVGLSQAQDDSGVHR